MAQLSLPPGFGFHPTDEELVAYYLRRKVHGQKIDLDIIPEVDLYKCEPWDLPEKSKMQSKNSLWHFFSPRDRKYPNGSRTNRATEAGYWKATGKDRKVTSQKRVIGTKKTLVFHRGRAPSGKRTDWVMHEYRIDESECHGPKDMKDSFVLCRVVKKNGFHVKDYGDASKPIADCILALVGNSVTAEAHSKGILSPNKDDCAETKPTLIIETPKNIKDVQEDMFSTEEWWKLLQADPEPDNTSWDESSVDLKVQDPSETEAFEWSQIVSSGDTEEEEILNELYESLQKSQANKCRQDGFQDEDFSKVFDYSQSFGDEDPGHDTTGIVLRPAKNMSGEDLFSDSTSVGKLRLRVGCNENYVEKQDKEHLEYYTEDNLTTDDYICTLQEQEILFDTLAKQKEIMPGNHGRVVQAEQYLSSSSSGIGQPYQSQPLPTNAFGSSGNHHITSKAEFLQGTENAETTVDNGSHDYVDVYPPTIHNHIVSSTHSETWVMSAGSAEVVESLGAVIESEVTRDENSESPAVDDLKEPDDFRSSSSTKASPSAAGLGHSGNSRRTKKKLFARKHRTGNDGRNSDTSLHEHDDACDGKGQSGTNTGSCLEEASNEFNGVSLSGGAPSSPTSVITFLCFLGTTLLLFLLYRGMLRVARILSTINF